MNEEIFIDPSIISHSIGEEIALRLPGKIDKEEQEKISKIKSYFTGKIIWNPKEIKMIEKSLYEYHNRHPSIKYFLEKQKENSQSFSFEPILCDEAEYLLKQMGFVKINESITCDLNLQKDREWGNKENERSFQWWAHPSGILSRLTSYNKDDLGHFLFNGLDIYLEIDIGIGRPARSYAINNIRDASSSFDLTSSGSLIASLNYKTTRHFSSIIQSLSTSQYLGKIIPFKEWENISSLLSSLKLEDWVSQRDKCSPTYQIKGLIDKHDNEAKKILSNKITKYFKESFYAKLKQIEKTCHIDGIERVFSKTKMFLSSTGLSDNKSNYYINQAIETNLNEYIKTFRQEEDDDPFNERLCSSAIDKMDNIGNYGLKKYYSDKDKKIISHWMHQIISKINDGNTNDIAWKNVQAYKMLENNISLPTLLLQSVLTNRKNAFTMLIKLIDSSDEESMENWCTTPDISGKTLPMYIFENYIALKAINNHKTDEFINKCIEKCCPSKWKMESDKFTLNGAWLRNYTRKLLKLDYLLTGNREPISLSVHEKLVHIFKEWGCTISDQWIWSEPFSMEKELNKNSEYNYKIGLPTTYKADSLNKSIIFLPSEIKETPSIIREFYQLVLKDITDSKKKVKRKAKM